MSLFRSRLFRWLAQSWPVHWGRQTRQRLQRPLRQVGTWIAAIVPQVADQIQPAIAPLQRLLSPGEEPPPLLLWLEGLPAAPLPDPEKPKSPRRLAAGVRVRLVRAWRSSVPHLRAGALAPPTTTLDRRVPRKSFAEILAEAIAYYFGRAKPSLPPEMGLPVVMGVPPSPQNHGIDSTLPSPPSVGAIEPPSAVPTLETRAVFLGYAYGPLVEFLLWLDRWVERIENLCLRIWHWWRQWRRA